MDFLKHNLFYVALIAAVVVLGGGAVGLNVAKFGKDVEAQISDREKAFNEARSFPLVNEEMKRKRAQWNAAVEGERKRTENLLAGQAAEYPVIRVTVDERAYRAFPYDEDTYRQAGLSFEVVSDYDSMWEPWLERIGATTPAERPGGMRGSSSRAEPAGSDSYYSRRLRYWRGQFLEDIGEGIEFLDRLLNEQAGPYVRNQLVAKKKEFLEVRADLERRGYLDEDSDRLMVDERADLPEEDQERMSRYRRLQAEIAAWNAKLQEVNDLQAEMLIDTQELRDARDALERIGELFNQRRQQLADGAPLSALETTDTLIAQQRESYDALANAVIGGVTDRNARIAALFGFEQEDEDAERRRTTPRAPRRPSYEPPMPPYEGGYPGAYGPEMRYDRSRVRTPTPEPTDIEVNVRLPAETRTHAQYYYNRSVRLEESAARHAWADARRHQAESGRIYADAYALDRFQIDDPFNADPVNLWQMQLNAWVQRDILQAIAETNEQVLALLPEDQRNVTNSAVKRLVTVKVGEHRYFVGETSGPSPSQPRTEYYPPPPGSGYGGPRGMPAGTAMPTRSAAGRAGETLTGHVSGHDYDVILYGFRVVMPERHVARLIRNLSKGKYHTVLKCDYGRDAEPIELPVGEGRSSDARERRDAREDRAVEPGYFYGGEPVVTVTIRGELLLQTDWARGKPHPEQDDKWLIWAPEESGDPEDPWVVSDKPLIPVPALRQMLPESDQVLRRADRKLMPERSDRMREPGRSVGE